MQLFRIMQQRQGTIGTSTADQVRKAGACVAVVALPWDMIAPHEKQAYANHSQSLKRLDERGGLDAGEALAVLEGRPWGYSRDQSEAEAHAKLYELLQAWLQEQRIKQAAIDKQKALEAQTTIGCTHHRMTLQCPICDL